MKLCGAADAGDGLIDGLLMPFLSGAAMEHAKAATEMEKGIWKEKISDALRFLHNKDIVRGDAKPDNIFITNGDHELFLFDFDGGSALPRAPACLAGAKERGLRGLERIINFIDNIDMRV